MVEYCKDCFARLLFTGEVDYCIHCQNIRNGCINCKIPNLREDDAE